MLTQEGCKNRQQRFREYLASQNLGAAVISDLRDIYYFTGVLLNNWFPALLVMMTDGGSWLVAYADEGEAAVDEWLTFEWNVMYTMNPDHLQNLAGVVKKHLKGADSIGLVGYQELFHPRLISDTFDGALGQQEWVAVDEALQDQQSRKDPDEVALIRRAIECDLAAYTAAQATIEPGVSELEVLAAGQRGAMMEAGERVFHDGDYQSGEFGGFARNRKIEKGELYIIDAWTVYRGYWSDLCRVWVVGGKPTDEQASAFEHVKKVQTDLIPTLLKPGAKGSEIYQAIDEMIREYPLFADTGCPHHAGHAGGLHAHEMPDLNSDREGILEPGNCVSVEPGGYHPSLRVGYRIENIYHITEDGNENLTDYPIDLIPRK